MANQQSRVSLGAANAAMGGCQGCRQNHQSVMLKSNLDCISTKIMLSGWWGCSQQRTYPSTGAQRMTCFCRRQKLIIIPSPTEVAPAAGFHGIDRGTFTASSFTRTLQLLHGITADLAVISILHCPAGLSSRFTPTCLPMGRSHDVLTSEVPATFWR